MPLTARAEVATDAPERYAKQLAAHLGRKAHVEDEGSATRIVLAFGDCRMSCAPGLLTLDASAPGAEELQRVQHVVGSHLERFGARHGLVVEWGATTSPDGGVAAGRCR